MMKSMTYAIGTAVLLLCGFSSLASAQQPYVNISYPETIYMHPTGQYVPSSFELRFSMFNPDTVTIHNVCVQVELEDSTMLALMNPQEGYTRCVDSLPPSTLLSPPFTIPCRFLPKSPMRDSTFIRYIITSFDPATQTEPDTVEVRRLVIQVYPHEHPRLNIFVVHPQDLAYSSVEGKYLPESFTFTIQMSNYANVGVKNARIELHTSDPQHLVPAYAGDSLIQVIDSIPANNGKSVEFPVRYTATTVQEDNLEYWVEISGTNAFYGDSVFYRTPVQYIVLLDYLKPTYLDLNLTVGPIIIDRCSGYDPRGYPATISGKNSGIRKSYIEAVEITLPEGWQLVPGYSERADISDFLDVDEEFEYTWLVEPPLLDFTERHSFRGKVLYTEENWNITHVDVAVPAFRPQLKFTPELPAIHVVYDAQQGLYPNLPVPFNVTLCAWGDAQDAVTVTAEFINGAWMFLEFDESQQGTEIVKHVPSLDICDSVALHWQANLIKQNEYGSPYEGKIKYTVYTADSSYYKEYLQDVIIDAVNQTAVADLPAAADMQLSAYPNPCTARTTVAYSLTDAGAVTIRLTDVIGREVHVVHAGRQAPGEHLESIELAGIPAGMYLLSVRSGAAAQTMLLFHNP